MCCNVNVSSLFINDNDDFDEQITIGWSLWTIRNNHVELQHSTGLFRSVIGELNSRWLSFVTHVYVTRQQRDYVRNIKLTSSLTTFAVVHVDFAENFTFIVQTEIQSAYWNQKQATVYTVLIDISVHHRNMVIVSNRMTHDTAFVYCTQKLIVAFILKEFPTINRIYYVRYVTILFSQWTSISSHISYSDGALSQYKNNNNILNLSRHEEDFGIPATWAFTSSGHGKSGGDGLGTVVKSSARRYLLKGGPEIAFSFEKDFYTFILKKHGRKSPHAKSDHRNKLSVNTSIVNNDDLTDDEDNISAHSSNSIDVQ